MTQLLQRLPARLRVLRKSPIRILTGVAIAMAAVAVYATSLKLERLLFGLSLDGQQLDEGVRLPAAAFDGHSTGTIAFSNADLAGYSIVGTGDTSYAGALRTIALPFYVAEFINALLVLALSAVVLLLCIRMLRGGPFVAATTASLGLFAVLLGVGSVASQLVRRAPYGIDSVAVANARERALIATANGQAPEPGQFYVEGPLYFPGGDPGLDLFPLGIAVLLGVIATAFWLGHRMQRDTHGLV